MVNKTKCVFRFKLHFFNMKFKFVMNAFIQREIL